MKNNMRFELTNGGGLGILFRDKIEDEFIDMLSNNTHIQDWLDKVDEDNIDVRIKSTTMSNYIETELLAMRRITKTAIKESFAKFDQMEHTSVFTMQTHSIIGDDGKVHIKGCTLVIRIPPLLEDIAREIYDLDFLWDIYKWLLRHEVGHFIDHIINDDGITVEEFEMRKKETKEYYTKHYQWVADYKKQPGYSCETITRAYYNIPFEARANEYAGIDIEDLIKLDKEHDDRFDNKKITLELKVVNIEDYSEDEDKPKN